MDPADRFPRLAKTLELQDIHLAEEIDRCFSFIESLQQELMDAAVDASQSWRAAAMLPELPQVPELTSPLSPVVVNIDMAVLLERLDLPQTLKVIRQVKELFEEKKP